MLLLGSLAWNGDILTSGSRDRQILNRDIRVSNDYTKKYFGNTDISTKNNDNVKIYAKYKGDMFDLNLITNGGYITSGDILQYEYGLDTYLPTNVAPPEEEYLDGKMFYGWYDNADFEGEEEIDASEDDNHDGLGFDIF